MRLIRFREISRASQPTRGIEVDMVQIPPSQPLSRIADLATTESSTAHARARPLPVLCNHHPFPRPRIVSCMVRTWRMHVLFDRLPNSPHSILRLNVGYEGGRTARCMMSLNLITSMIILILCDCSLARCRLQALPDSFLCNTYSFHDTSTFVCLATRRLRR
jgi:hypothetical protein